MAATYDINYNFERCTDVGSDTTFYNDGATWCHIKRKPLTAALSWKTIPPVKWKCSITTDGLVFT